MILERGVERGEECESIRRRRGTIEVDRISMTLLSYWIIQPVQEYSEWSEEGMRVRSVGDNQDKIEEEEVGCEDLSSPSLSSSFSSSSSSS